MIKNLKKLRTEYGLSQQQLADNIGVSQQSVNKYENHNIEPDIATLMAIASLFNTTIDYLVGFDESNKESEIHCELLRMFDKMTPQQQRLFIEQGKVFVNSNKNIL